MIIIRQNQLRFLFLCALVPFGPALGNWPRTAPHVLVCMRARERVYMSASIAQKGTEWLLLLLL